MVVLQKIRREQIECEAPPQSVLGNHSKESSYQCRLASHISFVHSLHLTLAKHIHRFIPLECPICSLEGKEAHPRFRQALDQAFNEARDGLLFL